MKRLSTNGATTQAYWVVMLLLLLLVLVASAAVLWLTNVAVRNERAAVRQRLTKSHENRLALADAQISNYWEEVGSTVDRLAQLHAGSELFAACIAEDIADSVVVLGQYGTNERNAYQHSAITYPIAAIDRATASLNPGALEIAHQLEFQHHSYNEAAETFAAIAKEETNPHAEARAWLAHARCLVKDEKTSEAIRVLTTELTRDKFREARDSDGRRIVLDAQLRAAQLMVEANVDKLLIQRQQETLREFLEDYSEDVPSTQRLFAMRAFGQLFPSAEPFATFKAEQLAVQHLASTSRSSQSLAGETNEAIVQVRLPGSSSVVLLFHEDRLAEQLASIVRPYETSDEKIITLPSTQVSTDARLVTSRPIAGLPSWAVGVQSKDPFLFDTAWRNQTAIYSLAALLTIAAIVIGVIVVAVVVRQQLRLAQLKNDLTAVVTHELRTPLASTRVLVDTLLDGKAHDKQQTNEYLRLIAKENERLSRLIENFLTFSRLQRNRSSLDFRNADPIELANQAVAAIRGKLLEPDCIFDHEVEANLPVVRADPDAFVTVLLNLLDNAVKFSGANKHISFRVCGDEQLVRFEVSDNGIGMSALESRRAFDQFFQADSRLSRTHGGCGLGLSLVRSIVQAHDGSVDVISKLGVGSTFTVTLPIVAEQSSG